MTLPSNLRVTSSAPFPTQVIGVNPIAINKVNGVWQISLSVTLTQTGAILYDNGQSGIGEASTIRYIPATGALIINDSGTAAVQYALGGSRTPVIQIHGQSGSTSTLAIIRWTSNTSPGNIQIGKSRGNFAGQYGIVQVGDSLSSIFSVGDDGSTTAFRVGFELRGYVDASPSAGNVPGGMKFIPTPLGGGETGVEALRIDSNGIIIKGGVAAIGTYGAGGVAGAGATPNFQMHGTGSSATSFAITRWGGSTYSLFLGNSRGASIGTRGAVQSGDTIANFVFDGDDGTNFVDAARITAVVDGVVAAGQMPGRLVFATGPAGATPTIEAFRIDSAQLKHFTHGAFGYGLAGNGDGGVVTQLTSKSTGVTLNTINGQITMNNAALGASTSVSFTLTDSQIGPNDYLHLQHQSGGTVGSYTLNAQTASGTATITVRNVSLGSLSEAIVISFALIKGTVT